MEINATLKRIHLLSPQPERMADFYANCYGMTKSHSSHHWMCQATGRELGLSAGSANQLSYVLFAFNDEGSWGTFQKRTEHLPMAPLTDVPDLGGDGIAFLDPDGNRLVFSNVRSTSDFGTGTELPPAMLQHFALRTQRIDEMLAFYTSQLGFVVSDRVVDQCGALKACFLRTDHLHHAMALFAAPVTCFDHQSYETPTWDDLKTWADSMGEQRVVIVWGVGRHGPGNDVFFMVRDPDGNLVEISSEIESCASDRPVGIWPSEEHTLNKWGKAIMRT